MTKPQGQAGRWPAGTRRPSRAAAAVARPPGSRARRRGPAPSPARSPPARSGRWPPTPPTLPGARRTGEPWDRRGPPIKFPLAAAGGASPLQGSERRRPGRRRVPAYLHGRLPAKWRRCWAPSRTCSPAWDPEATASVNTHTHTLAHDNFVVKGGPTPANQYHTHTHTTPGAQNHTEQVCVHGATFPHLQIQK